MFILYTVIGILTLILIFLLFAKINIFLEYKKYPGEKLYTDLRISVGFVKLDSVSKKLMSKPEAKAKTKKQKAKPAIKEKIITYTETFRILKRVYAKNRWYIRKRLTVDKLDFHLKFGLSDAAATGILTGAVWSLLYAVLGFLSQIGSVRKHFFEVVPVYTESGFASQGSIKLSLRMINIISVSVKLYLTYKKILKENK